jgi:fused signal recognition particle receptor
MSWFKKLKAGLSKTSVKVTEGLTKILTHKPLDKEALEELEDLLIAADIGNATVKEIIDELASEKHAKDISVHEVKEVIAAKLSAVLKPVAQSLSIPKSDKPYVVLVCGVNGNGKTTTLGKIALKLKQDGKKVMLAACDTFRAAALEQLKVRADRAGAMFFAGAANADPASVAYQAFELAVKERVDVLFIDTAGRLHNKKNLMDELAKINKVIKKIDANAPHNVILVLDATTGQNALSQVATFKELVGISGLIITKLDGTAKGGIVVAIAKKYAIPIYAIGVGEGIEDLNEFSPEEFARALVN